jgi:hypothetical protein
MGTRWDKPPHQTPSSSPRSYVGEKSLSRASSIDSCAQPWCYDLMGIYLSFALQLIFYEHIELSLLSFTRKLQFERNLW